MDLTVIAYSMGPLFILMLLYQFRKRNLPLLVFLIPSFVFVAIGITYIIFRIYYQSGDSDILCSMNLWISCENMISLAESIFLVYLGLATGAIAIYVYRVTDF
jgi:hypothetical protein